jgi:hypothetical protein
MNGLIHRPRVSKRVRGFGQQDKRAALEDGLKNEMTVL